MFKYIVLYKIDIIRKTLIKYLYDMQILTLIVHIVALYYLCHSILGIHKYNKSLKLDL